jgi:hypothetical protein
LFVAEHVILSTLQYVSFNREFSAISRHPIVIPTTAMKEAVNPLACIVVFDRKEGDDASIFIIMELNITPMRQPTNPA